MSLRTRLIIAFLLLSVVPLSAMTFISYRSSVTTFENAARREASQSAIDIGRRMERITADVGLKDVYEAVGPAILGCHAPLHRFDIERSLAVQTPIAVDALARVSEEDVVEQVDQRS